MKKNILIAICLLLAACSGSVNEKPSDDNIFQKALSAPPSPAEARIVGTKIDAFFASIATADQQYVNKITKIKWGDVYDYKALNNTKKLPTLRKTNKKAKDFSIEVFERRKNLFSNFISDLEEMAAKSLFARAMLTQFKEKYDAEETGFLEIEKEMRSTTLIKHDLIDDKLAMFSEAPVKYEVLASGEVKFWQGPKTKELVNRYSENLKKHNQLTAKQRLLGQYFINNRQSIVNRFHELARQ